MESSWWSSRWPCRAQDARPHRGGGGLGIQGTALLVDEPVHRHLELSARNLPGVKATLATALNVVDLLAHDTVVLSEAAVQRVSEVLSP